MPITPVPSPPNTLEAPHFRAGGLCLPETCSNNGVCYENFVTSRNSLGRGFTSPLGDSADYNLPWLIRPTQPFCDCDLTSYTGVTCSDGKEDWIDRL